LPLPLRHVSSHLAGTSSYRRLINPDARLVEAVSLVTSAGKVKRFGGLGLRQILYCPSQLLLGGHRRFRVLR